MHNMYHQLSEHDKKEEDKMLEEKAKKDFRMNVVNQQLQESKIKRIKNYQEAVIEGEINKKKAQEEVEDQKRKEIERKKAQERMNQEFISANINLEKLKEQKMIKEKLEEKKIEEYAIKKQQMVDLRKRKENEKFEEKQRIRQKLIDKQIEYLHNLKSREDEILNKQIKETEVKRENALAKKAQKLKDFKVSL